MRPKKETQKSAKSATGTGKAVKGFTDEERAAMKERAQELKAEARRGPRAKKGDGESDVAAKVRSITRGRASAQWPVAPGEIIWSQLSSSWGRLGREYKPSVTYMYYVGARNYGGSRVDFASPWHSFLGRNTARALVEKYRTGRSVQVYYDPGNLTRCVLEPGVPGRMIADAILYAVCLALGISVLL